MDAKRSLVHNWIMKARRDLLSAKRLARSNDPYLDTAIYHCQQTVEKAVKGWLIYNDQSFEKTHDLRLLVAQASEVEDNFADWFDVADQVSPYATAYRYLVKYWNQIWKNSIKHFKPPVNFTSLFAPCFPPK